MPIERDQGGHERSTAGSRVWHYNYFRSYSAERGRYTQADPIGLGGGLNRFGYVDGNPLSLTDPAGLCIGPLIAGCVWAMANAPWLVPTGTAIAEAGMLYATGAFSPASSVPAAISAIRPTAQAARALMNSPAAEICAAKGATIALGLGQVGDNVNALGAFSQRVGGLNYHQWEAAGLGRWDGPFEPFFNQAASRASAIHFSLDGIDLASALKAPINFSMRNNVTNSELRTILNNQSLLSKTTFYRNGQVVYAPR